jgi:metal-responsive CopG/Arc/MetJ family transcriptional regulator
VQSKKVHFKLSPDLLEEVDQAAARDWKSRSEWLRETIVLRLNKQGILDQPDPDKVWQAELERIQKLAAEDS